MKTLEEKKKERFLFLQELYNRKTSAGLQIFQTPQIAESIGLNINEGELIAEYLEGEGLIESHAEGYFLISITHKGKREIEQVLAQPDTPTEHFLPLNIIFNYGEMNNPQIMQGSSYANQTFSFTKNQVENLTEFVKLFEEKQEELPFKSEEDRNEAVAEVQTIKSQISSPRPKEVVIQESRKTMRNILEGMTGSILATELLKYLLGS